MNNLATILDLALARSLVVREVDADLGTYHGLSLSDFAILRELGAAPGKRLRRAELAERLGVTPSGVARQLAPLERIGLVGREPHARDARLALVVLTDTPAQEFSTKRSRRRRSPLGARSAPSGRWTSGSSWPNCSRTSGSSQDLRLRIGDHVVEANVEAPARGRVAELELADRCRTE